MARPFLPRSYRHQPVRGGKAPRRDGTKPPRRTVSMQAAPRNRVHKPKASHTGVRAPILTDILRAGREEGDNPTPPTAAEWQKAYLNHNSRRLKIIPDQTDWVNVRLDELVPERLHPPGDEWPEALLEAFRSFAIAGVEPQRAWGFIRRYVKDRLAGYGDEAQQAVQDRPFLVSEDVRAAYRHWDAYVRGDDAVDCTSDRGDGRHRDNQGRAGDMEDIQRETPAPTVTLGATDRHRPRRGRAAQQKARRRDRDAQVEVRLDDNLRCLKIIHDQPGWADVHLDKFVLKNLHPPIEDSRKGLGMNVSQWPTALLESLRLFATAGAKPGQATGFIHRSVRDILAGRGDEAQRLLRGYPFIAAEDVQAAYSQWIAKYRKDDAVDYTSGRGDGRGGDGDGLAESSDKGIGGDKMDTDEEVMVGTSEVGLVLRPKQA